MLVSYTGAGVSYGMDEQEVAGSAEGPDERKVVGCDDEVHLQNQIRTAIRMAMVVTKEARVRADHDARDYGIDGIVEGAAREIILLLGMRPGYVNIRDRSIRGGVIPIPSKS